MTPALLTALSVLATVAGATVAVCLGQIDGQTYAGLVGGALGLGAGGGLHAAGVRAGSSEPASSGPAPPAKPGG